MITVYWRDVGEDDSPPWHATRVLYAYLSPSGREILYIGKAYGHSVRERWHRSGKAGFWSDLERNRGIRSHCVIIGRPMLPTGMRLSEELLSDIESLLISELRPWGNIQCQNSRTSRPGLRVTCRGHWPCTRRAFVDM